MASTRSTGGVELGKVLANQIAPAVTGDDDALNARDASTEPDQLLPGEPQQLSGLIPTLG